MDKNMTALVSAFVKDYHSKNSNIKIYYDKFSILSPEEYDSISYHLENGIEFFNSKYNGNNELDWIVNNILGPSVLARLAFNQKHLLNEIRLGLKQYVVLGSGYDTSMYKVNKAVKVFELDRKDVIQDKIERIKKAKINNQNVKYISCDFNNEWIKLLLKNGFKKDEKTFCSILGVSYYLEKETFKNTLKVLSDNISSGSAILFDYPNDIGEYSKSINGKLAHGANAEMKSKYSYSYIQDIASSSNLLIYELLNNKNIDNNYFYDYNTLNPNNKIKAPIQVNYCLMVKK